MPTPIEKYICNRCKKVYDFVNLAENCEKEDERKDILAFTITRGELEKLKIKNKYEFMELVEYGINANNSYMASRSNLNSNLYGEHTCRRPMFNKSDYRCPACSHSQAEHDRINSPG